MAKFLVDGRGFAEIGQVSFARPVAGFGSEMLDSVRLVMKITKPPPCRELGLRYVTATDGATTQPVVAAGASVRGPAVGQSYILAFSGRNLKAADEIGIFVVCDFQYREPRIDLPPPYFSEPTF